MAEWMQICQENNQEQANIGNIVIDDGLVSDRSEVSNKQRGGDSSWGSLDDIINQAMQDPIEEIQSEHEVPEKPLCEIGKLMPHKPTETNNIFDEEGEEAEFFIMDEPRNPNTSEESLPIPDEAEGEPTLGNLNKDYYKIFENPEFFDLRSPVFHGGPSFGRQIDWEIS